MAEALGEMADAVQQAGGAVAGALASATGGWLVQSRRWATPDGPASSPAPAEH
jgi:hypothetical protein